MRRAKRARPAPRVRAVQYLRMSTPQQPHSLEHQAAAIAVHAQRRAYDIIRSYEDAAVSGVGAKRRPAFAELLATVLGGQADFEAILVYDVSRWGRFQDPDEAAHYEFLCSQEGVRIEYCAEAFGSAGSASDVLMKALKRAMAAEFSRDLGEKVRSAQRRYAAQGYWLYGEPGYGLTRQIVGADGAPGRVLARGERNADRQLRTILVPGPAEEVDVVRRMFRLCGKEGLSAGAIATRLNQEAIASPSGGRWSGERVRHILRNPKYMGDLHSQRRTTPLGGARRATSESAWIVAPGAGPALVPRTLFDAVQAALRVERAPDDEALLAALRPIAQVHGAVSEPQLKALGVPHHRSYRRRFGSLRAAFALIGQAPPKHFPKRRLSEEALLCGLARLFLRERDLSPRLIDADPNIPSTDHYHRRFGSLAKAYAQIGFVRISTVDAQSAVGQARVRARELQIRVWADRPFASSGGDCRPNSGSQAIDFL
ncbi:recombinase family protein [Phenylobacterium sp.]|uniref:recombinase family protein n=1 Tax=Phenylobacterium sp. TaxID=1871053 RepID=UPI00289C455E|nr:recombinase family protein [Phenylobacterium sp.]